MTKHGYIPIFDEESGENVLVSYDQLDSVLVEKLKMVAPVGGFCYAADDFVELPLTHAPYYLGGGWLPKQGKAEIFAPSKSGKSFLCLQLARCIGAGEPFLGMPTKQGKVLYLQFELAVEALQKRMKDSRQDYSNVFVGTTFAMKLDKKQGQEDFIKAMDAVRPDVVLLDPLYKMFAGDENEAKDVEVLIDFLDDVIDGYNCSILLTHHSGKDFKKGGRGSSVIEGWVDSYIEMKRTSKKGEPLRIRLSPLLLRHAELPPDSIFGELVDSEFILVGEEEKPKLIIDKVREYSEHHEEFKSAEIMEASIGSRAPVQAALNKLIQQGIVERTKPGLYRRCK